MQGTRCTVGTVHLQAANEDRGALQQQGLEASQPYHQRVAEGEVGSRPASHGQAKLKTTSIGTAPVQHTAVQAQQQQIPSAGCREEYNPPALKTSNMQGLAAGSSIICLEAAQGAWLPHPCKETMPRQSACSTLPLGLGRRDGCHCALPQVGAGPHGPVAKPAVHVAQRRCLLSAPPRPTCCVCLLQSAQADSQERAP